MTRKLQENTFSRGTQHLSKIYYLESVVPLVVCNLKTVLMNCESRKPNEILSYFEYFMVIYILMQTKWDIYWATLGIAFIFSNISEKSTSCEGFFFSEINYFHLKQLLHQNAAVL